jgi:hypothetical protein
MTYLIHGNITYSTAGNRNSALSAIQTTMASYSYENVTSLVPAGINSSGTAALTISITVSDADVEAVRMALKTAWTGYPRATTGHHISAVKIN